MAKGPDKVKIAEAKENAKERLQDVATIFGRQSHTIRIGRDFAVGFMLGLMIGCIMCMGMIGR
jgi:tetrahydromethanopterin S-methyltransferase subunit G